MRFSVRFLGIILLFAVAFATDVTGAPADRAQLVQRGAETLERLKHNPASWTAVFEHSTGHAYVKINVAPGKKRAVFIGVAQTDQTEFARIIMRDGFWYVIQGDQAAKFRPYEVSLDVPSLYDCLARSTPSVATNDLLKAAEFSSEEDGAAFFRVPMSPAMRGAAQSTADLLRRQNEGANGQGLTPQQREQFKAVQDTLAHGERVGIDLKTGVVMRRGVHGQRRWITNFRWDDSVDEGLYSLAGREWSDETYAFDLSRPEDVAMFNHCGMWRVGMGSGGGITAVLLNLKTGQMRRVPYDGGSAIPGCFSLDGKHVFVSGALGEFGAMAVFEIDLANGSKRRLSSESGLGGAMTFPTLSPDGKTIAAGRSTVGVGLALVKSQIVLIDVSSGKAADLGDPLYASPHAWLPDGSGLIMGRWNTENKQPRSIICRLDCATGELTEIRPGALPVVLRKSQRILFETGDDDRRWMTCDLDGSNATLAGDGLREFGFPGPSRTGDKVLMMRFGSDGPRPHIVDPVTGKAKAVKAGKGLWTTPVWQ